MNNNMINQLKLQKEDIISKMEATKGLYLKEFSSFFKSWIEEEALSTIKKYADKVVELEEKVAKKMKLEIKDIIDNANKIIQEKMGDDSLWWHTNENKKTYYQHNVRIMDEINERFRLTVGILGQIFEKYGIITPAYGSSYSSEWVRSYDNLRYAFGIHYSDNIIKINKEYVELIIEAQKLNEKISELEEEQKRKDVEAWWKSL